MSQPTNDEYVEFRNVQKSYDGETLAVKNLNLSIHKGEFITLLGSSGSGKTTTLMMLAGFETATNGQILLGGQDINRVPANLRNIGVVFQSYALFPHMTVSENLAFPLKVRRMSATDIKARVAKSLDMVQLTKFARRYPKELSGGQQQRIAVARSLIFEPSIVLMDEPLGALDKKLREEMQYEIKALHQRLGITMMYVTHDQAEAITLSDRIVVFDDGEVKQSGTPEELYQEPAIPFVADFIGENNRLEGTVKSTAGSDCTVQIDGTDTVVHCTAAQSLSNGDRCILSIRPEYIQVGGDASPGLQGSHHGVIREIIFKGDHLRARLNFCGHQDFIIKVPVVSAARNVRQGDSIAVSWDSKHCRAFRAI